MSDFYESLQEWLLEYDWMDIEEGTDHFERLYDETIRQGGTKELWIRWRAYKEAPSTPAMAYYVDFDFHCPFLNNTEIVKEGKKFKVQKGEVELKIQSFIELKYIEDFEKHFLLKHFEKLFTQRIYSKIIEQRKKELYQEMYILQNFIKQWFKMKRFLPYEEVESFFPGRAWPSHLTER